MTTIRLDPRLGRRQAQAPAAVATPALPAAAALRAYPSAAPAAVVAQAASTVVVEERARRVVAPHSARTHTGALIHTTPRLIHRHRRKFLRHDGLIVMIIH